MSFGVHNHCQPHENKTQQGVAQRHNTIDFVPWPNQASASWVSAFTPQDGPSANKKAKKATKKMRKKKGAVLEKAPKKLNVAKAIFDLLCDSEVFLALVYLMPMLEIVYGLIQFAQSWNVFIGDFVVAMKVYEGQHYQMYIDSKSVNGKQEFSQYVDLLDGKNSSIPIKWVTVEKVSISQVTFDFGDTTILAGYNDPVSRNEVFECQPNGVGWGGRWSGKAMHMSLFIQCFYQILLWSII